MDRFANALEGLIFAAIAVSIYFIGVLIVRLISGKWKVNGSWVAGAAIVGFVSRHALIVFLT